MELSVLNLGRLRAALATVGKYGVAATVKIDPSGSIAAIGGDVGHILFMAEDTIEPFTGEPLVLKTGKLKLAKAAEMAYFDFEAGKLYARLSESRTDEFDFTKSDLPWPDLSQFKGFGDPITGIGFDFRALYDAVTALNGWPDQYYRARVETAGDIMRFTFRGEDGVTLILKGVKE